MVLVSNQPKETTPGAVSVALTTEAGAILSHTQGVSTEDGRHGEMGLRLDDEIREGDRVGSVTSTGSLQRAKQQPEKPHPWSGHLELEDGASA